MSLYRLIRQPAGRLSTLLQRSALLCSEAKATDPQESLWSIAIDESLEHNYPSPWFGVVSEMLKSPFVENHHFVDFYGLLSDKPLSLEEIEAGRPAFSTGYCGPRFERAWLYASLVACSALNYRAMGHSFLNYFFANKEIRTPANFLGALLFLREEPADLEVKDRLITVMKAEMDKSDWHLCYKEVRAVLAGSDDWRTLIEVAPFIDFDQKTFYRSAFRICLLNLDLEAAREVVESFRKMGSYITLPPTFLTFAIDKFRIDSATCNEEIQLYLDFMVLVLQQLHPSNENSVLNYDAAKEVASWFTGLPSQNWVANFDCHTNNAGQCLNCKTQLERFEPTLADLEEMREDFRTSTLLSERKIYSSEKLLLTFEKFLRHCGPYDMVFDFENFKCVAKKKRGDLFPGVKYLIRKYNPRGILLINKLRNDPILVELKKTISEQYRHVKVYDFAVQGIYKDDAFMLNAAIIHDCYLVSNDAYRQHIALLPPKTKNLWRNWLVSRQIVNLPNGYFMLPRVSIPRVYGSLAEGCLHLPHKEDSVRHSAKHSFLCLQRMSKTES